MEYVYSASSPPPPILEVCGGLPLAALGSLQGRPLLPLSVAVCYLLVLEDLPLPQETA